MKKKPEGKRFFLGNFMCWVYPRVPGFLQRKIMSLLYFTEGKHFYSLSLRKIIKDNYGVEIGMYTNGCCFERYYMDRDVVIGRYSSIAYGTNVLTHDHPVDFPSTHAFFFNDELGMVKDFKAKRTHLKIGNDVWIGQNAIILSHVSEIGDGAIIGAGSVVNKNIPPYAIVFGNPARFIRFRFSAQTIKKLLELKWWEKPIEELDIDFFSKPLLDE